MAVFVVTWNLNRERANYDQARRAFVTHLERHTNRADSGLESVRWISTSWTAEQLYSDLAQKLDKNDRIFISKVRSGDYTGFLDQATIDWLLPKV